MMSKRPWAAGGGVVASRHLEVPTSARRRREPLVRRRLLGLCVVLQLLAPGYLARAGGPAPVDGRLVDRLTGRPIAGATINGSGVSVVSGPDGSFSIDAGGPLAIRALGY